MGYYHGDLGSLQNKIAKLLEIKKYEFAYSLLENSSINLDITTTYSGGALYCCYTILEIYLPLIQYTQISSDSDLRGKIDRQIIECAQLAAPPKENGVSIEAIRYEYDEDLDKENTQLKLTKINILSHDFLEKQIQKCDTKLANNDYDGVITNARTMLESIFLEIVVKSNPNYKYSGDFSKLYKETAKELKFDPVSQKSDAVKQIFSGLFSIVNGIGTYRNQFSDAHGKTTASVILLKKRHALLARNCAMTIADYLLNLLEDRNIKF